MIKITKKDIAWNYLGTILNLSMNVLILPVVLRLLSTNELGLWYVFGSMGALVQLLDFGFSSAIVRNFSYAWSGAKELQIEGIPAISSANEPNHKLVGSLLIASRKIYLLIALLAMVLLLSIGTLYINSIIPANLEMIIVAWVIYAMAIFINIYSSYLSALLRGVGKVKETSQAAVASRIVYVIIAIIGLLLGGGLIVLSFAYTISGILQWVLQIIFYHKLIINYQDIANDDDNLFSDVLKAIWPNARRQGVVSVGAWLVTRANTLICSSFLGLEITSQYGLSMQMISIIGGISSLLFSSYIPELTSLKIGTQKARYIKIFSRAISIQWITAIVGICFLTFVGPLVLAMLRSNARLLPSGTLLILGIVYFLEWNHSTFATLITLSNKVPFVKASIVSGVIITILSFISVYSTDLGIVGLILSQGLVQLSYNNWYWPRLALRENSASVKEIIISSVTELRSLVKFRHP